MRSLFLAFVVGSIAACSTDLYTVGTATGMAQIPRPIITRVTFKENPHTVFFEQDGSDPCTGLALTEDEMKEYFRVAKILLPYDSSSFNASPCRVYGHAILEDGRTASFHVDLNRLGRMETSDGLTIDYYCNDCKNEKFFEACDRECLQKEAE
jgi:hypothetical protein